MDLQNLTLFQMSDEKMRWLAQRQSVLAENIANSNTPDYMPSDLKPLKFRDFVGESRHVPLMRTHESHRSRASRETALVKTNPAHMSPVADGKAKESIVRRPFETTIDKNGVVLEEQMAKVDETRGDHDRVTAVFKKNVALINMALSSK